MKRVVVFLLLLSSLIFAQDAAQNRLELEKEDIAREKIAEYSSQLNEVEEDISKEMVWMKSYASYLTSLDVRSSLNKIKTRIRYLKKRGK